MKEALIVDLTGAIIDTDLVDDGAPEVEAITEQDETTQEYNVIGYKINKRVVPGTYSPIWDFEMCAWKEGKTPQEIEDIQNAPQPETPEQIRINELEADNATLWYENMVQSSRVEANEAEISAIWYEVMMGGV